jgi:hypothetical protein
MLICELSVFRSELNICGLYTMVVQFLVTYKLCLHMNVSLFSMCMQMSDPAADTYVSELDDTDAELVVAICVVDVWGRTMSQVPRRALVETGIQWVERTLQNINDCFDMFRMRRTVFRRLHDTLVDNYGLLPSRGVSTTEALGIFLWACGGPQSFR